VLVRIADDPGYTGQRRHFFRRPLRIAAGYQNAAIRIHPPQSPYRCARIFVCVFGHGAGIEDNNFGVARRTGALESALLKLPFQPGSVGLGSAAAKIFYVEASHAPILNEWTLGLKLAAFATCACKTAASSGCGALHL
jgi:hypothetical protein